MIKIDRSELSELLLAIANAAHAEYHYLELMMLNVDTPKTEEYHQSVYEALRDCRIALMEELIRHKNAAAPLWCTIKHILLALFHCLELFERTSVKTYLDTAHRYRLMLSSILDKPMEFDGFVRCGRCASEVAPDKEF